MPWPLSYRQKIFDYIEAGHTIPQAASMFMVKPQTIRDWQKRDVLAPDDVWNKKLHKAEVEAFMKENPALHTTALARHFKCDRISMQNFLKYHGLFKKLYPKYDRAAFDAYVKKHPKVKSRTLEQKFGVTRNIVLKRCKQLGIPRMDCRIRIDVDEFVAFVSQKPRPSNKAIMQRFKVSQACVSSYRRIVNIKTPTNKLTLKQFTRYMAKHPCATLNETMAHFKVSMPTVSRYRRLLKNTKKDR